MYRLLSIFITSKRLEKGKKYNPDNLLKNKEIKVKTAECFISMVEHKESIFCKIKNWFKRTF